MRLLLEVGRVVDGLASCLEDDEGLLVEVAVAGPELFVLEVMGAFSDVEGAAGFDGAFIADVVGG